jgi:HSP20 family protein
MRAEVIRMAGTRDDAPAVDLFDRFDRMFDDWIKALPLRRPLLFGRDWATDDVIRVDEYRLGDTLLVRAELAGIDHERDLDVTVNGGVLRITAHRREPPDVDDHDFLRHEIRTGTLSRTLPLPDGVADVSQVSAHYEAGILSIAFPWSGPVSRTKVTVTGG